MTTTAAIWADIRTSVIPQGDGLASYNSPYPDGDGPDVDCMVQIYIEGSNETGYILVTVDDADGPRDDAGREVHATLVDAERAAVRIAADKMPADVLDRDSGPRGAGAGI